MRSWIGNPSVRAVAGLAVVALAFFWALPSFASYADVWPQLRNIGTGSTWTIVALVLVGIANLLAPSTAQVAALPDLRFRDAVVTDWITSATTNVVPAGTAVALGLTVSMYRSLGLKPGAITRSIVVTGLWDAFVKLGMPLLAIAWLATQRPISPTLLQASLVGAILFVIAAMLLAVVLAGPSVTATIGRGLERIPLIGNIGGQTWSERLSELRVETVSLLADRWSSLTFWTFAGHFNLYLLLVVCVRIVGIERPVLGWAPILAAFAFGRLVTALPLTPGGLGVMEVGLTGALATVGDGPEAGIVAAVLLFRFVTFVVPVPLGVLSWIWWTIERGDGRLNPTNKSTATSDSNPDR